MGLARNLFEGSGRELISAFADALNSIDTIRRIRSITYNLLRTLTVE